jgi:hypothetical protein
MKTLESPECEKLGQAAPVSQKIGEFIDWLRDEKKISLATAHVHTPEGCDVKEEGATRGATCGASNGDLFYANASMPNLLAEFFGIDLTKVERERRAILDAIREEQAAR